MSVPWSLDRTETTDTNSDFCDVCREPTDLRVDDTLRLCGLCAGRRRVSDTLDVKLYRLAVG
jgi:hypothetical protein